MPAKANRHLHHVFGAIHQLVALRADLANAAGGVFKLTAHGRERDLKFLDRRAGLRGAGMDGVGFAVDGMHLRGDGGQGLVGFARLVQNQPGILRRVIGLMTDFADIFHQRGDVVVDPFRGPGGLV